MACKAACIRLAAWVVALWRSQPIASPVQCRCDSQDWHVHKSLIKGFGIATRNPDVQISLFDEQVYEISNLRALHFVEQQQVLQGDERIPEIRLAPVDELTVPDTGHDVSTIHVAVHDGLADTEIFHTLAHFFEDRADLLYALLLKTRRF